MTEPETLRMVRALEEIREGQKLVPIIIALIAYVSWLILR